MFSIQFSNDTKEKMEGYTAMASMFVKVIMASFPLLFVPQECDDNTCSMAQKLNAWEYLTLVNVVTFGTFGYLYYIQASRELFMIEKFDQDDELAENQLSEQILAYPKIHEGIKALNVRIKHANKAAAFLYFINTSCSAAFILSQRYLDTTTITVLLTNALLVQGKLMQIHKVYTGDDLAMSSVIDEPKVFNVIDKDFEKLQRDIPVTEELTAPDEVIYEACEEPQDLQTIELEIIDTSDTTKEDPVQDALQKV